MPNQPDSKNKSISAIFTQIGTIIGILTLASALFIAGNHPGDSLYEVSIYQAYPHTFWTLLFVTTAIGALIAFNEIFLSPNKYTWVSGFLLIAAVNILVLALQYLRDYAFAGQWDDVNHFSSALNIMEYGHPDPENFYPVSHVLAVAFSLLTGINLQTVILIFPVLFYGIFLANIIFVAWEIDPRPGVRGLMAVLATPLGYHTFSTIFRPTHFTVYMLPLLVGWLYKTRLRESKWITSLPFILILLFMPFLHPWAVIASAVLILGFGLAYLYTHPKDRGSRANFSTSVIILLVTWWTWFTAFEIFGTTLQRLVRSFIEGLTGQHSLADYVSKSQKVGLPFSKILSLVIYTYGPTVVYIGLGSIAIAWTLIQIKRRHREIGLHRLALSLFAAVFTFTAGLTLFRDLIAGSPIRISNFVFACVPLLISTVSYNFISGELNHNLARWKRWLAGSVLLVIFASTSCIGILGTYYAHFTGQPNHQLSYAQQAGLAFITKKAINDEKGIYTPFGGSFALASVFNKEELAQLRKESPRWWIKVSPSHLGYEWMKVLPVNFGYGLLGLGAIPEDAGYFLISAYEKAYYSDIWPEGGQLTPQDFETLKTDPAWCQVYTSKDLTIWRRCNE